MENFTTSFNYESRTITSVDDWRCVCYRGQPGKIWGGPIGIDMNTDSNEVRNKAADGKIYGSPISSVTHVNR